MRDSEWRKVTGKDECCNCGKTGAEHNLLESVFYCPGELEYSPVDGRCINCGEYEIRHTHTRLGYKDLACRIPHNAKIVGEFLDLPEIDPNRLTAEGVKDLNERFLEAAKKRRKTVIFTPANSDSPCGACGATWAQHVVGNTCPVGTSLVYTGVEGSTCCCGVDFKNHLPRGGEHYCPQSRHLQDALKHQEGGDHYKDLKIQPVEYIFANNIPFCEGNAIKYLTRWRSKGGVEDLKKAKHFIDLLIDLESKLG